MRDESPFLFFFVIYTLTSLLQSWPQLSCGEGHKQTATGGEFSGVYTALPEEPAEKILGTALGLERVTFAAAGNQVAVGIAAGVNPGNHVVEAARSWAEPAGTVEAEAAFARVDAFAQQARLQEIHLFELDLAGRVRGRGNGSNLAGQAHVDEMAGAVAFVQAQPRLPSRWLCRKR